MYDLYSFFANSSTTVNFPIRLVPSTSKADFRHKIVKFGTNDLEQPHSNIQTALLHCILI